jgi:hypothetical protein
MKYGSQMPERFRPGSRLGARGSESSFPNAPKPEPGEKNFQVEILQRAARARNDVSTLRRFDAE